jgi:hypothetical protein
MSSFQRGSSSRCPLASGRIGAVLTSGNAAAAGPATGVAGSAADEVSTGIAVLF